MPVSRSCFRSPQIDGQGVGVGIAVVRVLAQAAEDDAVELGGEVAPDHGHRPGLLVGDGVHGVERRLALEGELGRDHLVEDDAQREDVAAPVELLAAGLFGAHVAERAHDRAGDGLDAAAGQGPGEIDGQGGLVGDGLDELGQAEVEELGVAVPGDHDVVGLDVAVEDAGVVGLGQALGDLDGDLDRAHEVELAVGDDPADGPAVDILHGDEQVAVDLVDVVDLGDGRMRDGRGRAGLEEEPAPAFGVGHQAGADHLEGDQAVETGVPGPVDDAHAALAELGLDPVMLEDSPDHVSIQ